MSTIPDRGNGVATYDDKDDTKDRRKYESSHKGHDQRYEEDDRRW